MTKRLSARLAGALAILAVLASAAWAQEPQLFRRDDAGNRYSESLPGLQAMTSSYAKADKICPGVQMDISVSQPIATGDQRLDEIFVERFKEAMRQADEFAYFEDPSECPEDDGDGPGNAESSLTFEAHSASPSLISIVYENFVSVPYAAHPSTSYETFNYDLKAGRELAISDIFIPSKAERGLRALWAEVAKGWCAYNEYKRLPDFYNMDYETDWCASTIKAPLPKALAENPESLAYLGNAFLTEAGLALQLDAYQGWSYADGPSRLVISKSDMIRLGAKPGLWSR